MGCGATKNLQRQIREKSVWISHKFNEDSDNLNKNSHQIVEILSPKDFLHKGKKRIENNRPKTNDQRTNDFFEKLNLNQSFESKTRSRSMIGRMINGETRSRSMISIDFENSEMKKLDEKETEEAKNSISAEKMKELMENFENLAVVLKICETIENLNDPKLAENLKKLEMLSEIPRNENSGLRRKWARRLCEFGFVSFWTKLWPKFWLSECVERDEVELLVPRICFTYALRAMWNTTDLNHRACRQLAKQNGIAMIVEKLKSPIFDFNSKGNRFRTSTSKLISYRFRAPTSTSMSTSTSISTSTSSSNSNSNRLRSSKSNPTLKSVSTSASASTSNRFRAPTSNSVPTSTSASTSTSTSVSKRFRAQTSNSISNRFRTSNSTPNLNRHQSKNAVQRKRYFLNGLLSILHNSMRNCPEAVIQAKKSGAISIISKFLNTSHQITKLKAIICLIYLLPYQRDDEILKNLTKNQNLQQLLNSLKNSLQNEEHSNNGISAETIVDALNNLAAVNDFLKFTIVSMDLGPLLLKLINEAQNDFENYAAVKTVWNLSFHSTVKEQLKQEPIYMEALNNLKTHPNASLSNAINGILWNLSSDPLNVEPQASNGKPKVAENSSGHVMISYDWSQKKTVLILQKVLQNAGYQIWINADRSHESTFAATIAAIQNAAVVLLCISARYQNSPACRTEAENGIRFCKPMAVIRLEVDYQPGDWLGALIASRPCLDCPTINDFNQILPELIQKLDSLKS